MTWCLEVWLTTAHLVVTSAASRAQTCPRVLGLCLSATVGQSGLILSGTRQYSLVHWAPRNLKDLIPILCREKKKICPRYGVSSSACVQK